MDFAEILRFNPDQLLEIFSFCKGGATTCSDLDHTLKGLNTLVVWSGPAAEAARDSVGKTRVDVAGHQEAIQKVGQAANDCYEEAVFIQRKARDCEDKLKPGWSIVSNTLVAPHLADSDRTAFNSLQSEINDLISDADRFDEDLAALFNVADGQLPLTPGGDQNNANEADRRANEYASFMQTYGRPPLSENDWRMAESLDPHTYDPKYRGAKANITIATFNPEPGAGVYRQNMYIPVKEVQNLSFDSRFFPHDVGDNRGPDANAPADASRVSLYADMDHGILVARQNPSASTDGRDLGAGVPQVAAMQSRDGSLVVDYSAADPFAPGPTGSIARVAGQMTISPAADANLQAHGTVTSYPSNEAYQYKPDGTTNQLLNLQATTSQAGPMTNLPFGPDTNVGNGPLARVVPWDATSDPLSLPGTAPTILHRADLTPLSGVGGKVPHIGVWSGGDHLPGTEPVQPPQAAQPGTNPTPPPIPVH